MHRIQEETLSAGVHLAAAHPEDSAGSLAPEPVVTYRGSDVSGKRVEHGELIIDVDETRRELHAQHHPHGVLETRRVPGTFGGRVGGDLSNKRLGVRCA